MPSVVFVFFLLIAFRNNASNLFSVSYPPPIYIITNYGGFVFQQVGWDQICCRSNGLIFGTAANKVLINRLTINQNGPRNPIN